MWPFFLQDALTEPLVRALCWTFIHSLWQGLLAAVLAGVIIVGTRRSAAALRYNLLTALLALFVAGAATTFIYQWRLPHESALASEQVSLHKDATTTSSIIIDNTPTLTETTAWDSFKTYFDNQAPLIVLLWGLCFLYHAVKLLAGLNYVHRLRYQGLEDPTDEWKTRLAQLSTQLGIRQRVALFQSHLVKVPAVVGLFKPVVLLPVGLLAQIPPAYVETILLHELAHIRRKDFGVNLLQSLVEMVFFFNPALMWLSSLIRQEREACCDDIVVAHTGNKKDYLEALVSFQEAAQAPTYALALSNQKTYLLHRVRRMLTQENKRLTIMEKLILFTGLLGFSAFAFVPQQKETIISTTHTSVDTTKPVTAVVAPAPLSVATTVAAPATTIAPVAVTVTTPAATTVQTSVAPVAVTIGTPVTTVQTAVAPVTVVLDTVPTKGENSWEDNSKYPVKNINTRVYDEGGKKIEQTIATMKDGKTYRIKKVDNVTTEVAVNGELVAKEQWNQYQDLWDGIERRRKESEARRKEAAQRREEQRQVREDQMQAKREQLRTQQRQSEEQRRAVAEQRQEVARTKAEARRSHQGAASSYRTYQAGKAGTAVGSGTNNDIDVIVDELIAEKIIKSPKEVTFTLTSEELIVNGKKQDASVQQRLKERLKIDSNDSFQYKRDGNNTTTTIVRN
jgi:bla regulator protein blaR1